MALPSTLRLSVCLCLSVRLSVCDAVRLMHSAKPYNKHPTTSE